MGCLMDKRETSEANNGAITFLMKLNERAGQQNVAQCNTRRVERKENHSSFMDPQQRLNGITAMLCLSLPCVSL
jgi:hypothetical protein